MKNLWPLPRRYYYAAIAAVLGIVLGLGGPGHVEALLFPIKTNSELRTYTYHNRVCVEYDMTRHRIAHHVFQSWTIQFVDKHGIKHRTPITMTQTQDSEHIGVGQSGTITLCGYKPKEVGSHPYLIYAYYSYEVWHGLWHVPWHICKEH